MVNANGIPRKYIAANSDNATVVKASAGAIGGFGISNKAAYGVYVKFYDKATAPAETDTPVFVFEAQATSSDWLNGVDMAFQAGISFRIVKDQADNGTTAVAAGDCVLSLTFN